MSCDHQNSKLRAVAGAEGFWVAELRVRQRKIGSKSCFAKNNKIDKIMKKGSQQFGAVSEELLNDRNCCYTNQGFLDRWMVHKHIFF